MNARDWALALKSYYIDHAPAENVILSLDQSLLSEVAAEGRSSVPLSTTEEAEQSFLAAVRDFLSRKGNWRGPMIVNRDQSPDFLLLIFAQIYAVSKMDDDPHADYGENNFWHRLADLYRLERNSIYPLGWKAEHHQDLWHYSLVEYLKVNDRSLTLPNTEEGTVRRHVRLPFSQALLRTADLERLPDLFHHWRWLPGESRTAEQIAWQIECDRSNSSLFATHARRVLSDEDRRPLACQQIALAYECWNGEWKLPVHKGRRGRNEVAGEQAPRLLFDVHERTRRLLVRWGANLSEAESLEPSSVVELFPGGHRVGCSQSASVCWPRFQTDALLAVYDEEQFTYRQESSAQAGDRILLFYPAAHANDWERGFRILAHPDRTRQTFTSAEELAHSTTDLATPNSGNALHNLPRGWRTSLCTLRDPLPTRDAVPLVWRSVLREAPLQILLVGGLRLDGRKDEWLVGAGPTVKLGGPRVPRQVTINGRSFAVTGRTVRCDLLDQPGEHRIEVRGGEKLVAKQILVREARIAPAEFRPSSAWLWQEEQWPKWALLEDAPDWLFGTRLDGNWTSSSKSLEEVPARRTAVDLILGHRQRRLLSGAPVLLSPPHPLVQVLESRLLK